MTKEEAITLNDNQFWVSLSHRQRAEFQLIEERLCMPFSVFHEAIEKALGRQVFIHENRSGLADELFRGAPPPTVKNS